jgi:hypothetical protein
MTYGTTGIENEAAYEAAIKRNIIRNAFKTFSAKHPDVVAFLDSQEHSGSPFIKSLFTALYQQYGKLSDKQCEAVRKYITNQEVRKAEWADKRAAEKAKAEWIGDVGARIVLKLTVNHVVDLEGQFGWSGLFICTAEDGNKVIYKGTTGIGDKGDVVTVKATVKEHGVRDGEKQTIIARPIIVDRVNAEE